MTDAERMRRYRLNHPDYVLRGRNRAKATALAYYYTHLKECRAKHRAYLKEKSKDAAWVRKRNDRNKQRYANLRTVVLHHYGNKCVCCGETIREFLGIDHINGNGKQHRKITGMGENFYRWVVKNGFPKDLQILCYNCNITKMHYGSCPHQKRRLL